MKHLSYILFSTILFLNVAQLISCRTYYDIYYDQIPPENMRAYIIDTISMNNPIVINYHHNDRHNFSHNNISYLVDMPIDSIPRKNIKKFLDSTPSYYFGSDDLFWLIPISYYDKLLKFPTLKCYECWNWNLITKKSDYSIYQFEKPVFFLLVAVNVAYANTKLDSIDYPITYHSYSPGKRYIVLAFPIGDCEEYKKTKNSN